MTGARRASPTASWEGDPHRRGAVGGRDVPLRVVVFAPASRRRRPRVAHDCVGGGCGNSDTSHHHRQRWGSQEHPSRSAHASRGRLERMRVQPTLAASGLPACAHEMSSPLPSQSCPAVRCCRRLPTGNRTLRVHAAVRSTEPHNGQLRTLRRSAGVARCRSLSASTAGCSTTVAWR